MHTLPGRLIVIGIAIRFVILAFAAIVSPLPTFFAVVDTVAALAIAVGALYFVVRLFIAAKRRLLWRVRRKLILSYIFVGFVPTILIVVFFLLGGFLLFYNLSSYLVETRLRALSDEARFLARSAALEIQRAGGRDAAAIVGGRQANAAQQFPGMSIAIVPVARTCGQPGGQDTPAAAGAITAVGPWMHTDPPPTVPAWIACSGFGGLLAYSHPTSAPDPETHLLVRAAAFPDSPRPGYAVVVDLPITDEVTRRLRNETGVELRHVSVVPDPTGKRTIAALPGRDGADGTGARTEAVASGRLDQVAYIDVRDWITGNSGQVTVQIKLSIGEIWAQISGEKAQRGERTVGSALLLLLGAIGLLFLIIEALALIAGLALAKSITGSIHELFVGTSRVRQGDFTHKIPVKSDDQLGELTDSFNTMTASIEDLLRQAAEKKRLEEELRIAREIQMSLLPQGPLLMPGLSVTALCVPAREVGGDYYDYFPIDDHRMGILIADVSGKGTSAALYMAELKGLMLSLSQIHTSPRQLMITANGIIADNLDARSFITMTYAVVDLFNRTMTYARAGHTPLMYLPGAGCTDARGIQVLVPDGLVLGLKLDTGEMFERLLEESTIKLNAGDLFVFYTDGISEAMNEGDDCFGENRLGQLVEEHAHLASAELRERILREIEAFVGDAPQHDDMTMILLKIDEVGAAAATIVAAHSAESGVGAGLASSLGRARSAPTSAGRG